MCRKTARHADDDTPRDVRALAPNSAGTVAATQIMSFSVSQRITGQPMNTGSQHVSTR